MAKSRKGKKASRNLMVEKFIELLEDRFSKCPFDKRMELFKELEDWAKRELNEESCEIFLEALYNAPSTEDIQLTIGLENALAQIKR